MWTYNLNRWIEWTTKIKSRFNPFACISLLLSVSLTLGNSTVRISLFLSQTRASICLSEPCRKLAPFHSISLFAGISLFARISLFLSHSWNSTDTISGSLDFRLPQSLYFRYLFLGEVLRTVSRSESEIRFCSNFIS